MARTRRTSVAVARPEMKYTAVYDKQIDRSISRRDMSFGHVINDLWQNRDKNNYPVTSIKHVGLSPNSGLNVGRERSALVFAPLCSRASYFLSFMHNSFFKIFRDFIFELKYFTIKIRDKSVMERLQFNISQFYFIPVLVRILFISLSFDEKKKKT